MSSGSCHIVRVLEEVGLFRFQPLSSWDIVKLAVVFQLVFYANQTCHPLTGHGAPPLDVAGVKKLPHSPPRAFSLEWLGRFNTRRTNGGVHPVSAGDVFVAPLLLLQLVCHFLPFISLPSPSSLFLSLVRLTSSEFISSHRTLSLSRCLALSPKPSPPPPPLSPLPPSSRPSLYRLWIFVYHISHIFPLPLSPLLPPCNVGVLMACIYLASPPPPLSPSFHGLQVYVSQRIVDDRVKNPHGEEAEVR